MIKKFLLLLITSFLSVLNVGCFADDTKNAQQLEIRPGITHSSLLNSAVGCEKISWSSSKNNEGKKIAKMDCLLNSNMGIQADLMKSVSEQIRSNKDFDSSQDLLKATTERWQNTFGLNSKIVISYTYKSNGDKVDLDDIRVFLDGNERSIGQDAALSLFAVLGLQQPIDLKQQKLQWARILIINAQPNPMKERQVMTVCEGSIESKQALGCF